MQHIIKQLWSPRIERAEPDVRLNKVVVFDGQLGILNKQLSLTVIRLTFDIILITGDHH